MARLHGKIIAQGGTPELALRASQQSRHKEKPEIIYVPTVFRLPALIEKVRKVLGPDQEIFLVGGAVRDLLLARFSPDLDFAVPTNGISIARKVADALNADFIALDEERDTGRVIVTEQDGSRTFLDFATYRSADSSAGRGQSLEQDLSGRDFTINALAYDLQTDAIIDPLDGATDLRAKIIRVCAATSLADDPVRILRAVRQAAALGLHIDRETRELMKQAAGQLATVSAERLRDELFKILNGPKPDASVRALELLGVFPYVLPELIPLKGVEQSPPHIHDVWTHTLAVLGSLAEILAVLSIGDSVEETNDPFAGLLSERLGRFRERFAANFSRSLNIDRPEYSLLFFAALYHDVSKPETKTIEDNGRIRFLDHDIIGAEVAAERARVLNLSNGEVDRVQKIIQNHMRIHFHAARLEGKNQAPSPKSIYRFFRDTGDAGVDLALLSLADVRGTYGATLTLETWSAYLSIVGTLLEHYWERPQEVVSPPRLLDGDELMKELGLKPGPIVGQLLETIRENQAAGIIENREQALAFARAEVARGMAGRS